MSLLPLAGPLGWVRGFPGDPFGQHDDRGVWVETGLWPRWPWLLAIWSSLLGWAVPCELLWGLKAPDLLSHDENMAELRRAGQVSDL